MNILIDQEFIPAYSNDFFNGLNDSDLIKKITVLYNSNFGNNITINYDVKKIKILNLFGFIFKPLRFFMIFKKNPSVVILSANQRDILLPILIIFLRLFRKKVFIWGMFHKVGGQSLYSNFFYFLISNLSHKSLVYSKYGAIVLNSLLIPKRKVFIIGTGLSSKHNLPLKNLVKPIEGHTINFLCVMRLSFIKNPLFLIDICELFIKQGLDFSITCIGGGEAYEDLKRIVKSKCYYDKIFILPAIYSDNELEKYFLKSHFSLLPSCPGLSIHHSFAYALPVISDNLIYENSSESLLLQDGVNSIIYDYNNMDLFMKKLSFFLNDYTYNQISVSSYNTTLCNNLSLKITNFLSALND